MNQLIEEVAKRHAIANNGGDWAVHYTEEHKKLWRQRASELIEFIRINFDYLNQNMKEF